MGWLLSGIASQRRNEHLVGPKSDKTVESTGDGSRCDNPLSGQDSMSLWRSCQGFLGPLHTSQYCYRWEDWCNLLIENRIILHPFRITENKKIVSISPPTLRLPADAWIVRGSSPVHLVWTSHLPGRASLTTQAVSSVLLGRECLWGPICGHLHGEKRLPPSPLSICLRFGHC